MEGVRFWVRLVTLRIFFLVTSNGRIFSGVVGPL
jgi:hypothetical protein